MSISSRDKDKDGKPKEKWEREEEEQNKKRYIRVWRLEASKEFVLIAMFLIIGIGLSSYNPWKVTQLGEYLVEIAEQNKQTNIQNLNNTDRIIEYLDIANRNDTAKGIDIIKVLFLFMQDAQRDDAKIMQDLNISNTHFVHVNNTHVITENGSAKLPYPIDMTGFLPINQTNQTNEKKLS